MDNYITYEEFQGLEDFNNFIRFNPSNGFLKVQVYTANGSVPVPGTRIFVYKDIGDKKVIFYDGETDESGMVDNIVLPSPRGNYNAETFEIPDSTIYTLVAYNDQNKLLREYTINVYGDTKAIQNIKVVPSGDINES